jgi:transaldolase
LKPDSWKICPDDPPSDIQNPSSHLVQLALAGFPELAADTILNRDYSERLSSIIEEAIRLLNLVFIQERRNREACVRVLLEIALNLFGMESKRASLTEAHVEKSIDQIFLILKAWEELEKKNSEKLESTRIVVHQILRDMRKVLKGQGMVAKMADAIESGLDTNDPAGSFLVQSKRAIRRNVYYEIVSKGLSKIGNDSATGLRWLRHLGAVQVSSNPVIAARAFEEFEELWSDFGLVASTHPEWKDNLEQFADEIALYGTVTSLLPNVLDFRPIALLSGFEDGMVSIQINPNKASSARRSLEDAERIYSILGELLRKYDPWLMPKLRPDSPGRPNVVFKVATSEPEAIDLTESLDGKGMGTNNTVTFSVSQEIKIVMSVMKGLAHALKSGIPITRVYITNMEGRLEDHLRECLASDIVHSSLEKVDDRHERIKSTISKVTQHQKNEISYEAGIELLCSKRYLKSLCDKWFIDLVGVDKAQILDQMESDIRMSGIFVTRRVFKLVFDSKARSRWGKYVQKQFEIPEIQASDVIDAIDLLPSSKRRDADTLQVLGNPLVTNLTNTEFPDQQLKVWNKSHEKGFELSKFENSISIEPESKILERLLEIGEFRKAYLLTAELTKKLKEIGIDTPSETGGLGVADWKSYGPTEKTMEEFKSAYLTFRDKLVQSVENSNSQREKLSSLQIAKTAG